jgi:hypothetical protein
MTPFQLLAIAALAALTARDLAGLAAAPQGRGLRAARAVTWAAAAAAIAAPGAVQAVAVALGIHRGADLVAYAAILGALWAGFTLWAGQVRLERQLTEVVRALALSGARRGGDGQPGAP